MTIKAVEMWRRGSVLTLLNAQQLGPRLFFLFCHLLVVIVERTVELPFVFCARMCVRASVRVCGHQIKVGIVFTQHRWYCVLPLGRIHLHTNTSFSHYRFSIMTQICSDVLTEGYKSASEATCRRQRSEEAYTYVLKGTFSGFGCEWKDGFSSELKKASSNNKLCPPKYFGCQAAWKCHRLELSDWPLNVSQRNSRNRRIQK